MRKKGGEPSLAGLVIIILLLGAIIWLGAAALINGGAYRREAAVTPTPSITPRTVAITENPAGPTSTPTPRFFQLNSVGAEVRAMQERLQALGYYAGELDGQFGGGTQQAVVAFQTQHGLRADGIAGEQTLNLLYHPQAQAFVPTPTPTPTAALGGQTQATDAGASGRQTGGVAVTSMLSSGAQGAEVETLQARLKELGYYAGAVDGDFGKGTKTAVTAFQKRHDLDADGIVGDKTIAALFSAQAKAAQATATPERVRVAAASLPLLVNKEFPIQKDDVPANLVNVADVIDADVLKVKYAGTQGVREAVEALDDMLRAAKADGVTNWQLSAGYRSYADQENIFNSYVQQFVNEGRSRQSAISRTKLTVADPGASEHHTGLAFDLNVPGTENFKYTDQCKWLHKHCWDYGFIIRYTDEKQDITGFMGEEWHVRYVGTEHSLYIRDKDWCLEEYLMYTYI